MIGKFSGLLGCFMAALLPLFGAAAQEPLALPEGQAWTHPHSGIGVPAKLAGIERAGATAFAEDHLNVGIAFDGDDEALSVYIYRNTSGGVPVWFEQARWAIENRANFGKPQTVGVPYAFSLPGRAETTGLKVIYRATEQADIKATGLALFSLGEWYVKMRASSDTRYPTELEAWMTQALNELDLPADLAPGPSVSPVADCRERLSLDSEAKDAPKGGAAALLGGMLGMIGSEKASERKASPEPVSPDSWCRDSSLGQNQTVYRPNAATDRYLIALGDSGIGVSVYPDSAAALLGKDDEEKASRYTTTMIFGDRRVDFVAQDRLPSPERVVELINEGRSTVTVSTWGDDDTTKVNSDAM